MLTQVAGFLTGLALVATLYAAAAAAIGARRGSAVWAESARNGTRAAVVLLGLALVGLLAAFLGDRFEVRYVAQHSSRSLPLWLKISAVWGGQEGSLLLWAWMQALFAALASDRSARKTEPMGLWVMAVLNIVTAFFTAVTLFASNPFAQTPVAPPDGAGLNPLLRHPGMIFHPPTLYLGYVGLAVPYAYAVAGLLTGDLDGWIQRARTWTLAAWFFLGLGLLLGARWAYDVLGWGGYWAWDPVENAGLMPWLAATALLHGGSMRPRVHGEGHAPGRLFDLILAVLSFALVVFGAFATRSGMIQSIHAFSRSNMLGATYLGFTVLVILVPAGLMLARRGRLRATAANQPVHWREASLTATRLLFVMLTASVFIGSTLPTLTEWLGGRRLEAGPEWFDRVTGPQFAALVLLMGVCPLLGRTVQTIWRRPAQLIAGGAAALLTVLVLGAAGFRQPLSFIGFLVVGLAGGTHLAEFVGDAVARHRRTGEPPLNALWALLGANRRRYGGYLVHLGVVLMALGVIGTRMYPEERQVVLSRAEPQVVGDYTFVYELLSQRNATDYLADMATVTVYRDGAYLATLRPELHRYLSGQTIAVPALRSGLREDLYVTLAGSGAGGGTATFRVVTNRLVNLLWLGGLALLTGGAVAFWPSLRALEVPLTRAWRRRAWNAMGMGMGVTVLSAAVVSMWGVSHGVLPGVGARPQVGSMAPDFTSLLMDGSSVRLSDLRGQVVVLNVWASWCPSCRDELVDLQAAWEEYGARGVRFIGLAYNDEKVAVREAVSLSGVTYDIGLDGQRNAISRSYGVRGVPETFVVDAEGRLAFSQMGVVSPERLRTEIDRLLDGGR